MACQNQSIYRRISSEYVITWAVLLLFGVINGFWWIVHADLAVLELTFEILWGLAELAFAVVVLMLGLKLRK